MAAGRKPKLSRSSSQAALKRLVWWALAALSRVLDALDKVARAHQTSLFKAAWLDAFKSFGLRAADISKIRAFSDMINGLAMQAEEGHAEEIAFKLAAESGN